MLNTSIIMIDNIILKLMIKFQLMQKKLFKKILKNIFSTFLLILKSG